MTSQSVHEAPEFSLLSRNVVLSMVMVAFFPKTPAPFVARLNRGVGQSDGGRIGADTTATGVGAAIVANIQSVDGGQLRAFDKRKPASARG